MRFRSIVSSVAVGVRFWLPALVAIVVLPAGHTIRSRRTTTRPSRGLSGSIASSAVNPHVVLIVEGPGPDGRTGRWAFEGSPPNGFLRRQSDFRERLKPGTRITISGWPAKDPNARAFSGKPSRSRTGRRWSSDRHRRGRQAGAAPTRAHTPTLTCDSDYGIRSSGTDLFPPRRFHFDVTK